MSGDETRAVYFKMSILRASAADNAVTKRPSDHLINELRDPRGGLGCQPPEVTKSRNTQRGRRTVKTRPTAKPR